MLKPHIIWTRWVVLLLLDALPLRAVEHTMSNDGAWCWFQDPRAVFVKGRRTRTYAQWVTHDGRLQIGAYDHETGRTEVHTLKEQWDCDDHNVGSLIALPDNRIMVFYARHSKRGLFCRTSSSAEDILQWDDEVTVSNTGPITYNHPLYLSEEKKFYVFWRGPSWEPTFSTSRDGRTWSNPCILLQGKGRVGRNVRQYMKIVSDGTSSIHFAFTDGHPRSEKKNSLYYARYEGGIFSKADGSVIGKRDALPIPHGKSDMVYDGDSRGRAWVWDIAIDDAGLPVIAYTRLPAEEDHRYCYARWTGEKWQDTQIAEGGKWFPQTPAGKREPEPHYSGGMGLDHSNPSTVYFSRQVNGAFEIEKWDTPDKGRTWRSLPITRRSEGLNVRPVVPRGYSGEAPHVLWMFGSYEHYTRYRTGIKLLTI
ncbi:MAG: BNR-4 repeat-containing protein [Chloroflexota bacterium]|nr:BNR-4 repeat-containing protein [Chloroflexota bacterium]